MANKKIFNNNNNAGLNLINAPAEFEENLPKRVAEFIPNDQIFAQLDEFLRTPPQLPKILVLTNPLLEQRKVGIGKKTFVSEFCYTIKSKIRFNVRWLDAQSFEIFQHQIDEFAYKIKADQFKNANNNGQSTFRSQLESLFRKIETDFKWRTLFVIKNLQNWENIGEFIGEMIKSNKCKAILISRSNLRRTPNQTIRFVEFTFRPSFADCHRYLSSHLKSRISSEQLNQIIEYQSTKFKQIMKPFDLEKLAFYIKYNYLYTIEGIMKQLSQIECFQITYVLEFIKLVDTQSHQILFLAKYLYADFIPIELIRRVLSKKRFEIQSSVKLLIELDLVELVDIDTLKISRLVLDEVKEKSIEEKAKIETKLAQTLIENSKTSMNIYYPSVVSFLSLWKNYSVRRDDQEFNKNFAQLCYEVGEYNFAMMRLETAIKFTEMGLKRDSNQTDRYYHLLGECYFDLENYQKALDYFNKSNDEDDDDSSKPYFMIGKCYFQCEDYSKAVDNLRKANESNPNDVECIYLLALSYERLEKHSISVKYNQELLKLLKSTAGYTNVDQIEIYISLGNAMNKLNNHSKSLEYYEKAFEIVSKTTDHQKIAWLLVQMGKLNLKLENYDQAVSDFRTAYDLRAGSKVHGFTQLDIAETLNLIGISYRRKRNFEQALKYLDSAFRLRFQYHRSTANVDVVDSYINLGLVNRDLGQQLKSDDLFASAYEMKKEMVESEIDNKLDIVEKWPKNQLKQEMNKLKAGNMKKIIMSKINSNLFNGKSVAQIYLFCKDDASLFKEIVNDESLSNDDCVEFIKWFNNISLVQPHV